MYELGVEERRVVEDRLPGQFRRADQAAVQDERAAHPAVAGRHDQQVPGVAAGSVPVLGQRGQVDVVGRRVGTGPSRLTCIILFCVAGEQNPARRIRDAPWIR